VRQWNFARSRHGRLVAEWLLGQQWYAATHPFGDPKPVPRPNYGFFDENVTIAEDRRGREARIELDDGDVTVAYRRVGGSFGGPRTIAHVGPRRSECQISAAMNRRRRVFVAWACDPIARLDDEYVQGAVLAPDGRVESISERGPGAAFGEFPGIDFDDHGRGIATWVGPRSRDVSSLLVTGGRVAGFRDVARIRGFGATFVDAVVDRRGQGTAAWADRREDRGTTEFRVATIDLRDPSG
jgi:hypothetical protein